MACIEPESSLSQAEMQRYLQLLADRLLQEKDISAELNEPFFKVRSRLRELLELEYIGQEGQQYTLAARGKEWLRSKDERTLETKTEG